jgi:hypothetical protein
MIDSSAEEVEDGLVVGERVRHIVSAHVLRHVNSDVNSDDLRMYHVAACQ